MKYEEDAVFTEKEIALYKKYLPKHRNFLFRVSTNYDSSLEFLPALSLSFLAWPIMIWYWTKTFIYPIFSISASLALLAISIYFGINDGTPSFYLCTGYVILLASGLLWCLGFQKTILTNYFGDQKYDKPSFGEYEGPSDEEFLKYLKS